MRSLCVFCGARVGVRAAYTVAAQTLGRELSARGITLIYGGGRVGLMGVLAQAALDAGAEVVGVIPEFLRTREVAHTGVTRAVGVGDLFERKAVMMAQADAFVALPGGIGTLDELLEVIAWRQLRQLPKPIGLLNIAGHFDPLLTLFEHLRREEFASDADLAHIVTAATVTELLDQLAATVTPA